MSARCDNCDRVTWVSYDHALDADQNYRHAAIMHARRHHTRHQLGEGCWTRSGAVFPLVVEG